MADMQFARNSWRRRVDCEDWAGIIWVEVIQAATGPGSLPAPFGLGRVVALWKGLHSCSLPRTVAAAGTVLGVQAASPTCDAG